MLYVIIPNVVTPNVIVLSAIMLYVVMPNVVKPDVDMRNVIMPDVVMTNVMAPYSHRYVPLLQLLFNTSNKRRI